MASQRRRSRYKEGALDVVFSHAAWLLADFARYSDWSQGHGRQQCVGSDYSLLLAADTLFDVLEGAVAIRLSYLDTTFCFLTAHLAAGHSNIFERDADYATIETGLKFSKGRGIVDHECARTRSVDDTKLTRHVQEYCVGC